MQSLVVLVFSSILAAFGPVQATRLSVTPEFAIIGDTVTISCEIPARLKYEMFRLYRGGMTVFSVLNLPRKCGGSKSSFRPSFQQGVVRHSVHKNKVKIVLKAELAHSGRYTCRFLNGINDYVSKVEQLTVGKAAQLVKFTLSPAEVLQGKMIQTECVADKGIPKGRLWIKDSNNKVIGGVETTVTSAEGKPLTMLTAKRKAPMEKVGETFHCQVENIFNRERNDLKVKSLLSASTIVYHPPNTVSITPKKKYYKRGDELLCNARGYPRPSFKWLVNNTNTIHKVKGDTMKLRLTSDTTRISCIAENTIKGSKFSERKVIWFIKKKDKFVRMNRDPAIQVETTTAKITTTDTMVTTDGGVTTTVVHHKKKPHSKNKSHEKTTTPYSPSTSGTTESGSTTGETTKSDISTKSEISTRGSSTEGMETTKGQGITPLPLTDEQMMHESKKRYEKVMLYLKLSIALNLVFGVVIMFFLIGLCLRISSYLK